jgi:osmoprotectant transport system permease protein
MTSTLTDQVPAATTAAGQEHWAETGGRRAEAIRTWFQPLVAGLAVAIMLTWVAVGQFDEIEVQTVNFATIGRLALQHVELSLMITLLVVVIAVPLGTALTRRWGKPAAPLFLAIANIGQAAPSIGVLVLFYLAVYESGWSSFWIAVLPIAFYALLPVLRNTILGIESVDSTLVEAGRGIGMSRGTVLRRLELPLALPFVLAGLRTSLVLAVGSATLATFVGGGGLGVLIDTGYKLSRTPVLVIGAVLAMALALLIDWLGGLAERWIGPKGLR